MVLFLSYLYPNVINIIVLLLKLHPIVLPEIYELDYKHAIVTALLIYKARLHRLELGLMTIVVLMETTTRRGHNQVG